MALTAKDKLHLRKLLKQIRDLRAPHTEFVTVYVPAGYDLVKIQQHLADELGTASNIKSASTRKNVQNALEKMIGHLKTIEKTPPNGLACFCGNIAANEGKQDFQIWSMEPPEPLNLRLYRCDKTFVIEPLEEMMIENNVYGLVVLDRRDANLALLKGKTIIPVKKTHSEVPGKFKAGGQSAARFARQREGAYKDHFKKIADHMKEQFLPFGNNLKGIIIGGPGTTVNDFLNKDYITGDLKKKILGTKDLSYTGDFGLQELLDKADDILSEEEITQEKRIMQIFFKQMLNDMKKIAYGEQAVRKAMAMNAVDILLVSESMEEDKIFELEDLAQEGGSEVRIISVESREGVQLRDLGKVAAILRFEVG
ncbi:peptide chain release factor 1 [Candidatus Woesearchaeota archaeon CG10_big_fil_rev_8_21_14_0_10_32_24]|nr:MAG: peptide chain release factor 1 [Candidatus Woesearchaeota archaeon CG10_big_fil_rev_8_21_14_0_10_32_24]